MSFGANAGDPHHEPDDTVLKRGDVVLFDIGGRRCNYCSDMTRTFFWGEPDEETTRIYDIVRRANEAAEALIAPGVRMCDLDRAARDVIEDAGYGQTLRIAWVTRSACRITSRATFPLSTSRS